MIRPSSQNASRVLETLAIPREEHVHTGIRIAGRNENNSWRRKGLWTIKLRYKVLFSPEIIRPYPKAGARNTKNKRKTRKSAILTDTPEKDALALEQSSKKRQKTEQGGAGKGKKIAKKTGEKCAKRKVLQDSDEESVEDDSFCLVCCESFEQSRAGEEWVQCVICKKWSHVRCTKGNIDTYVCLNCDNDSSD
nr:unnamed protein product [Callosobruchus chinensis]